MVDPEALARALTEVAQTHIELFCTGLFGFTDRGLPDYRGSATLVTAGGKPCLLTAQHVWRKVLRERDELVAFGTADGATTVTVRTRLLDCIYESNPKEAWWGPDVALVQLPPSVATRLNDGRKVFYDLGRRREMALATPSDGYVSPLRFVVGAPGEWVGPPAARTDADSTFDLSIGVLTIATVVRQTPIHEGRRYIDIAVGPAAEGDPPPGCYKGLSGAGLWNLGPELDGPSPFLEGVVFYELPGETSEPPGLRCHGTEMVYGELLDAIGED